MKKILSLLVALLLSLSVFAFAETPTLDRAGNEIKVPTDIKTVISLSSAASQTLENLGVADKLVAVDTYSALYLENAKELPQIDMMAPDMELLMSLEADVIILSNLTFMGDENPFAPLIEAGTCVISIPTSESILGVQEDIAFIGSIFNKETEAQEIIDTMDEVLDEVATIGATIQNKKSVMFEISAMPYLYSFGTGTFLDEMITLLGATNVLADQAGWLSITEEAVLDKNPDVILTNVNYIEDPVAEILARTGWDSVTAVQNKDVHVIDNAASSLANENIVFALVEMAKCIYPNEYEALTLE